MFYSLQTVYCYSFTWCLLLLSRLWGEFYCDSKRSWLRYTTEDRRRKIQNRSNNQTTKPSNQTNKKYENQPTTKTKQKEKETTNTNFSLSPKCPKNANIGNCSLLGQQTRTTPYLVLKIKEQVVAILFSCLGEILPISSFNYLKLLEAQVSRAAINTGKETYGALPSGMWKTDVKYPEADTKKQEQAPAWDSCYRSKTQFFNTVFPSQLENSLKESGTDFSRVRKPLADYQLSGWR